MKLFITFAALFTFTTPPSPLLLIDKDLKQSITVGTDFTQQQFMKRRFPLYQTDVTSILNAADSAAKLLAKGPVCFTRDTIKANHSTFILVTDCEGPKSITVYLLTQLEETGTTYSYPLVKKEQNIRKAQLRLLDFASYIAAKANP